MLCPKGRGVPGVERVAEEMFHVPVHPEKTPDEILFVFSHHTPLLWAKRVLSHISLNT